MEVSQALALIRAALERGSLAGGYLAVGDLREQGIAFAEGVLAMLFPEAAKAGTLRSHPDVAWLEPQGKSRTIKVQRGKTDTGPGMRDGIVEPMAATAFSGGWKAGVIVAADRMQPEAANAFLKTLEEPPERTVFLLLTDQPDSILPTIVSRTQRIDLPLTGSLLSPESTARLRAIFASAPPPGCRRAAAARELARLLEELCAAAEPSQAALVRKDFFKAIEAIAREWLVAGALPLYQACRNIEAVETAYRRCERFIPAETVLAALFDTLKLP